MYDDNMRDSELFYTGALTGVALLRAKYRVELANGKKQKYVSFETLKNLLRKE